MSYNNSHKSFTVVSISFEKANAEIRGKFTFFSDQVADLCSQINNLKLGKCFILSTCNRTEIYCYSSNYREIIVKYCEIINVSFEEFISFCDVYENENALKHLFRVSSGLESQILGDFEIIAQIKTWYKRFQKNGTTNFYLERAYNTAIQISKQIKNETFLSTGVASISYAAVHYILNQIPNIKDKKILLIGTGKIGQNTCENLIKHISASQITLMNRSESKSELISKKFDIKNAKFQDLESEVNHADAIIVATSAHEPILLKSMINSDKKRHFIDLSVPNNIEKSIKDSKFNYLINVDDLSKIIDDTLENRKSEIPKAEIIIEKQMIEFQNWLEKRKFAPIIKALKQNLYSIQENEIKDVAKSYKDLNENDFIITQKMSQRITNRFADFLMSNPEKADLTIEIFSEMFQLVPED